MRTHPTWEAVVPGAERLLEPVGREGDAWRLRSTEGDCWREVDTHRAVFVAAPPCRPPWSVEATLSEFVPADPYAQAGLVLWRDADRYVRLAAGFMPAGVDALLEWGDRIETSGLPPLWPRVWPMTLRLRMDVGRRVVRTWVADEADGPWWALAAYTLPDLDGRERIGLLGVGGRSAAAPVLGDWRERPIPDWRDDDFDEAHLGEHWTRGRTVAQWGDTWGDAQTRLTVEDGHLLVQPFPGSHIDRTYEVYPFISQSAPDDDTWAVEVALPGFDGTGPGRWRRAGMVLWERPGRFIHVAVVVDDLERVMNLEAVGCGLHDDDRRDLFMGGFGPPRRENVWLRLARTGPTAWRARGSFDRETWIDLGGFEADLAEPRLRLFATGDPMMFHPPGTVRAAFDYARRVEVGP